MSHVKSESRSRAQPCMLLCAVPWVFLSAVLAAAPCGAEGCWKRFPKPPTRAEGLGRIAFDETHALWAVAGTSLYFWNGTQFEEFRNPRLTYPTGLYGGPDRGLYVTRRASEPSRREIWHLAGEQAVQITEFLCDPQSSFPHLYVTRDRRFLNWTRDCVQIYSDNAWHQLAVDPNGPRFAVYDLEQGLYLYGRGVLYSVDSFYNVTRTPLRTPDPYSKDLSAQWGTDTIVLIDNADGRPLNAHLLADGAPVPIDEINAALEPYRLEDLQTAPDGSVWFLARPRMSYDYFLVRLHPDGTVESLWETQALPWSERINRSMRPLLLASDGSVWIGFRYAGVIRWMNGQISQSDYRNGHGPSNCWALSEGPDNAIYATSDWWLYAFREGQPRESNPYDTWPAVRETQQPVWMFEPAAGATLKNAWQIGELSICSSKRAFDKLEMTTIETHTGTTRFRMPLPDDVWARVWVTQGHTSDTLLVQLPGHIQTMDIRTGQVLADIPYDHDTRIAPVLNDGDYVLIKGHRGTNLVRINSSGEEIWSYKLFDYFQRHPSRYESLLVVQTPMEVMRAIDLNSGETVWSDFIGAKGWGTTFAPNGEYTVEAACPMSPESTQGWIIARDSKTGEIRWHYRRPVNMVFQCPIVDAIRDQVYAAFEGGEIVCLDLKNGGILWETILPDKVHPAPTYFDEPYWPSMGLVDRLLTVIDRNGLIYTLDADTGKVKARFDVTGRFLDNGIRLGSAEFVAMPSIVGDLLIVPASTGITAYSLSGVLE